MTNKTNKQTLKAIKSYLEPFSFGFQFSLGAMLGFIVVMEIVELLGLWIN